MMKMTFAMSMVLLVVEASAWSAEPEQISLNGEWDFTYTGSSTAEVPDLPPSSAYDAKIEVPSRWDDQLDRFKGSHWWPQAIFQTAMGPVQYLYGMGWHRRTIDVPEDWADRAVTLTVGQAVGVTRVWVNGKFLGENRIGVYTPWEVDLTHALKPGEKNELVIAVDNAARNIFGGWTFLGNAGTASGLARPVTLHMAAGPGRIADLYVKPGDSLKELDWQADLAVPGQDSEVPASKLAWKVRDFKSGNELGRGEIDVPSFAKAHQATWKAGFDAIKPWSDREPNLYVTEVRWLGADGEPIDSRTQRFGLRRWSYEGRRLFLNGQPTYLRHEFGAYYFPNDGAVSMSKEYWLKHMKCVKALGLNGVNFAAQVCPVEMMEAADEVGVVLQCGDHVTTRPGGIPYYREVWESIARTTRRHPSVAIYGFGGELKYYDGVVEQNKAQMDLIKSLNSESLVMPQQAIHGIDYGIEDTSDPGVMRKPFVHHAERLAKYAQACDLFGHYSGGAFSHSYFSTPWRTMEERFQIYSKPLIAHELFISASYLNPENMRKYTGRIPPYIYQRVDSDLRAAGLLGKWPTYFDHTSRLQHICRKYCFEKVRKCDGLAGFELLGMMDMHALLPEYAVGIVDEFLQLKPGDTVAGVRRYTDESVLLLDFDNGDGLNRCYWEGEPFEADIMASLYGPTKVEQGTLTWRLKQGDETVLEGTENLTDVSNGRVSTLKALRFNWPKVDATTRLNLSVQLNGSGYSLANDWDFWVFPRDKEPKAVAAADKASLKVLGERYLDVVPITDGSKEQLRIVAELGQADIEHLDGGGDVVLMGTKPFTAYTQWPYFYPSKGYRPFSNGGTIFAKHPIFAGHPNDGWNDWHFYPLMQGANSVLFDGTIPMEFDPILEIISSAGHVRRQALVFEERVGKGRLFVTTLKFDMNNPSCATMMDSILRYAQSEQFQPRHSIDASELRRALSPQQVSENRLEDASFEKTGHWVTENGKYEIDGSTAHEGRKSLKLAVSEDELRDNRHSSSRVSARQITFKGSPRRLKLSAWFKTSMRNQTGGPKVTAYFRYQDAHIRSSSFSISMTEPADDWQYVENIYDLDGKVTVANVHVDLTGAAGTAWVDDLYFGEAPPDAAPTTKPPSEAGERPTVVGDWKNRAVTRTFDAPMWFRVDKGEWAHGDKLTVDREGVHVVSIKKTEDAKETTDEQLLIDLSPPIVTLEIVPQLNQEAGIFTTNADTVYSVTAADGLSGVKTLEFSTNGKDYSPYSKPFTLPPGRHVIMCRAIDQAGNLSSGMTGEWITGSDEAYLEVDVSPAE